MKNKYVPDKWIGHLANKYATMTIQTAVKKIHIFEDFLSSQLETALIGDSVATYGV